MKSYLEFKELPNPGHLTKIWEVVSVTDRVSIGRVGYLIQWRRYIFCPFPYTKFDAGCLREIAEFCESKTKEQMDTAKKRREENKIRRMHKHRKEKP